MAQCVSSNQETGLREAVCDVLLARRADVEAKDKRGATPMHRAVGARAAWAVQRLLRAGARHDVANRFRPCGSP